jgi:hypothetical protein
LGRGFQGAGGIGGLLARTTYGQELPGAPTTSFYHADGNFISSVSSSLAAPQFQKAEPESSLPNLIPSPPSRPSRENPPFPFTGGYLAKFPNKIALFALDFASFLLRNPFCKLFILSNI